MSDFPTYGDVLGRPATDPARDQLRATREWTPVAIPGRPGWWRHWVDGVQVDTDSETAPDKEGTT
jgi:hypothetical protein